MGKRNEEGGQELFQKYINNMPKTTICAIMSPFMHHIPSQNLDCESTFEPNSISNISQDNLEK